MSQITVEKTVGQLVAERPGRARLFEKLGVDYCCGGKRPLGEVCAEKGLDRAEVVRELEASDSIPDDAGGTNWNEMPLGELADHIISTHHAYLKMELPRLAFLTNKVANAHGSRHPEMIRVRDIFAQFKQELESHMIKEEAILFPMCKLLETATVAPHFHCGGTIQNPIRVMEQEHQDAGDALAEMRALTHDFTPPADACNTFRVLLDSLAELEADMHGHVHKENNILFPRAAAIEAGLPRAAGSETLPLSAAGATCKEQACKESA
ncbi:MAG TPA: iron-sulfur cluster repair di-iron protein [Chthonomonadaceae bacterium]|nr:iron-sulfur cluster repair di-iron protein [Chthonomonadaceae bacterium]